MEISDPPRFRRRERLSSLRDLSAKTSTWTIVAISDLYRLSGSRYGVVESACEFFSRACSPNKEPVPIM